VLPTPPVEVPCGVRAAEQSTGHGPRNWAVHLHTCLNLAQGRTLRTAGQPTAQRPSFFAAVEPDTRRRGICHDSWWACAQRRAAPRLVTRQC